MAEPAPTKAIAQVNKPVGSCREAIAKFWPVSLQSTAITILRAENGLESPKAINYNTDGSVDKGCFQVNSVHRFTGNLFEPEYNAQMAYKIYQTQGVRAWYAVQGILW